MLLTGFECATREVRQSITHLGRPFKDDEWEREPSKTSFHRQAGPRADDHRIGLGRSWITGQW